MAGTIVADTIQDGAGNSTSMDNAIYGSAKAWVQFAGSSTPTINASYNVSSVTSSATGIYQINFTNAFADNKYATSIGCGSGSTNETVASIYNASTTTYLGMVTSTFGGTNTYYSYNSVIVFHN